MTPDEASARLLAALETLAVEIPRLHERIASLEKRIEGLAASLAPLVSKIGGQSLLAAFLKKL